MLLLFWRNVNTRIRNLFVDILWMDSFSIHNCRTAFDGFLYERPANRHGCFSERPEGRIPAGTFPSSAVGGHPSAYVSPFLPRRPMFLPFAAGENTIFSAAFYLNLFSFASDPENPSDAIAISRPLLRSSRKPSRVRPVHWRPGTFLRLFRRTNQDPFLFSGNVRE
jgi:hypothetical protein